MDDADEELPDRVIDQVDRLTRKARRTQSDGADSYREQRDQVLAEHGFEARIRSEDAGDVLVLYPERWMEDQTVALDKVEDRSRAIEINLDRPESTEDWETIEEANRAVVNCVAKKYGPVHEANARAFAEFMSNHQALPIAEATQAHVREFLDEFYPRNTWPSQQQRCVIEQSLVFTFEVAGGKRPPVKR